MKKSPYRLLYMAWGVLFVLTAVLGFFFPDVSDPAGRAALTVLSVLFFLPPWLILRKSRKEGKRFHSWLIGFLSMASIVLTLVLLVLNLMSPLWEERVGIALNAALVIVSAPMVCSNFYALPLFLWGVLLVAAFKRK
jgi:riboflavin transporter FmnP